MERRSSAGVVRLYAGGSARLSPSLFPHRVQIRHGTGDREVITPSVSIQRTASPKPKPDAATLTFCTVFTDHMILEDYDAKRGWVNARIEPYHRLSLDP